MTEVSIDSKMFISHALSVHKHWVSNKEAWNGADCLAFLVGKSDDDEESVLTSAIQNYLFGYEFNETIFAFTEKHMHILCTKKRATKFYEPLVTAVKENAGGIELTLHIREKSDFETQIQDIITACKGSFSGAKMGAFAKEAEKQNGDVATVWNKLLGESKLEIVDVVTSFSACTVVKDDDEINKMKKASTITAKIMKNKFKDTMENIIETKQKKSHSSIAAEVDGTIEDPSKIGLKVKQENVDAAFPTIVQSGGNYSLKFSAEPDKANLSSDTIVCCLGVQYQNYSSCVARTYFVQNTKGQKKAYSAVYDAFIAAEVALIDGGVASDVYDAVKNSLTSTAPELVKYLKKDVGFSTGLQFKDPYLSLKPTNKRKLKTGMVVCLSISLEGIPLTDKEESGKGPQFEKYGIWLADTIMVTPTGGEALTKVPYEWRDISYYLDDKEEKDEDDDDEDDDEDDDDDESGDDDKQGKSKSTSNNDGVVYATRGRSTRGGAVDAEERRREEEKRRQHQIALMNKKRDEHMKRLRKGGDDMSDDEEARRVKDIEAYATTKLYPRDMKDSQIHVDMEKEVVLVPIGGVHVPFHISTIKNVSTADGDKSTYLRLNFYFPPNKGRDVPQAMKQAMEDNPLAMYIKTLNFKSTDPRNLMQVLRLIKQLQKDVKQRLQKEEDEADLVEQEALVLLSDEKPPRLQDVYMRPYLSGRKSQGTLIAHSNGFRFKETRGAKLDILYSNIQHALFQPCVNDLIVVVHFHLKHPIMIGKKKCKDVQFYTEVIEASQTLDSNKRSVRDPDELDEEQRERLLRKKVNGLFKHFTTKVESLVVGKRFSFEFENPYMELSFQGAPDKEMVTLRPASSCLVSLVDQPPFVASIRDWEHVHFERVNFNTRNFDMTIIWKDLKRLPHRIGTIANDKLEQIQAWLDDINMTYTYGPKSIQWNLIMEESKDTELFWSEIDRDGERKSIGWNILAIEDDIEDEDEDDEESDEEFDEEDESEEDESDDDDSDVSLDDEDDDDDGDAESEEEESEEEESEEETPKKKRKRDDADSGRKNAKKSRK